MDDLGGQWKQLIYKHASEIVRSCKFKKGRKRKPVVKNFAINIDQKFIKIEISKNANTFDKWIRLRIPFIKEGYKRERIEILLPIKEHKHSLKFKNWQRAKSIRLSRTYATFTFEKEEPKKKKKGRIVGIDQGYKKLLVTSDRQFIGKDFEKYYEKIARKKQGSKAFKRALIERDNEINRLIKTLDLKNVKEVRAEDLKDVKKNTRKEKKIRKKFNNKLQRWVYTYTLRRLALWLQINRVSLMLRNPAFSSQTCSRCWFRHKNNRRLERFKCLNCGFEIDADYNASCVIKSGRSLNVPMQEYLK